MYSYVTCVTGAHNTVLEQILRNGSGTDLLQIFKKEPCLIGLIGLLNEVCLEGCYPRITLRHMVVFLLVMKSRGGRGRKATTTAQGKEAPVWNGGSRGYGNLPVSIFPSPSTAEENRC